MNRYVCIHGHFYQPPRENPWLEEVELQDSAYPFHDWNERITADCYAPNTASRILSSDRRIIDIVNNYAKISFNFGPSLLSWIERHQPEVYQAVIEADRISQQHFSGHGSAIAQIYKHMIMPLANSRDKRTQVLWGIRDFEYRFGRKPEGIWLSETAVDIETLEILAEYGIKFTILAQRQAHKVRRLNEENWEDVSEGRIDPKRPYLCRLPSGKAITIFFYDGAISQEIAFNDLLISGESFAHKLMDAFQSEHEQPQLVHVATDGETYGHHHHHGDMALAYCLYYIESNQLATITNYGEYLEKFPPEHEVEIFENSSWSCIHGVERWRNNCGCNSGMHPGWQQAWRAPLRGAMDWLRDSLIQIYEENAASYLKDPWLARDEYIEVILNRTQENVEQFFSKHAVGELLPEAKVRTLKLLEMQRHAMLSYSSCGWFFDEISGIETVQVMHYAARAMHLAIETTGVDLEPAYIKILERAPSNIPKFANGARVYEMFVQPSELDILRVGAHYAISSLFEKYPETTKIYCYEAQSLSHELVEMGKQKLALGKANLRSDIDWEEQVISFAVVHLGDHNLIGGIRPYSEVDEETFNSMCHEIKDVFFKSGVTEVIGIMDKYLGNHSYSLWHLFKDERRDAFAQLIDSALGEIETHFRQAYEHHYSILQSMSEMRIPFPKAFATIVEFNINTELRNLLEDKDFKIARLQSLVEEVRRWSIELDMSTLNYVASRSLTMMMDKFSSVPEDLSLLGAVEAELKIFDELSLQPDIWKAQNIYFKMGREIYDRMAEKASQDNQDAKRWIELFHSLGDHLQVRSY